MTKEQALRIQSEIMAVCVKHGIWATVVHECKPDLKVIRVQEISIKIDDKPK